MTPILEVQSVNKRFGGLKALDDVNLTVMEGTVHAIIGPNGAGKSTLLNCFVGRLVPDTGTVTFAGQSLIGKKPHEINQAGGCTLTESWTFGATQPAIVNKNNGKRKSVF